MGFLRRNFMNVYAEPPARKPKGRKRQQALYLHKRGQVLKFESKADLLAYITSMRKGR
jgi:hypothetical protein